MCSLPQMNKSPVHVLANATSGCVCEAQSRPEVQLCQEPTYDIHLGVWLFALHGEGGAAGFGWIVLFDYDVRHFDINGTDGKLFFFFIAGKSVECYVRVDAGSFVAAHQTPQCG